mgnify:CR=1 FL=1
MDDLFDTLFPPRNKRNVQPAPEASGANEDSCENGGDIQPANSVQSSTTNKHEDRQEGLLPVPPRTAQKVQEVQQAERGDDEHGRRDIPVPPMLDKADTARQVQGVDNGSDQLPREAEESDDADIRPVEESDFRWFAGAPAGDEAAIAAALKEAAWVKREESTTVWEFPWAPGITEEQKAWSHEQLDSVIPRLGAKSKLRGWLVERFPKHHTYVEPFGGSFKVLLWKRSTSKIEIINDADAEVINFFRYVTFWPDKLADMVNAMPTSKELMYSFRDQLKAGALTGLQRAAAFYVVARLTFNGIGRGYAGSVTSPARLTADKGKFEQVAKRLKHVDMRNDDAFHLINVCNKELDQTVYHDGVFFYMDPPYDQTEGYRSANGKDLGFGWDMHEKLYEKCCEIDDNGNKFIQTNSSTDRLYELYGKKFHCVNRSVNYTVGKTKERRGERDELIIANFDLEAETKRVKGGLFG